MRISTRTLAVIAAICAALFLAFVAVLLAFYFPPPMETIELPSVPTG